MRLLKKIILCSWRALVKTISDEGVEHAGYMSFMVLLSLFPSIVFFLAINSIFGASELGSHFIKSLIDHLPADATAAIKERIYELTQAPPQRLLTLAIIGSLWTASSFVEGLRTILNRVYELAEPPPYILRRLLSVAQFFLLTLFISFVMFLLVIIPVILQKLVILDLYYFTNYLRLPLLLGSLFITTIALYYMIPNLKLRLLELVPGTIITVILWFLLANLLSTYLAYYKQLSLVYGSLGGIIVTLVFFYLVNMIFIYGAEFNYFFFRKLEQEKPKQSRDLVEL